VKARRLRAFVDFLGTEYGGRVRSMSRVAPDMVRRQLLAVPGIGPETADAILLYAVGFPVFVVDAYTRRAFRRLGFIDGDEDYETVQDLFTGNLPADAELFNDYHAQVVALGKDYCRPRPVCTPCPLDRVCRKVGVGRANMVPGKGASRFRRESRPREVQAERATGS
jgi:endonuclease-3 related protein